MEENERNMSKKNASKGAVPVQMTPDDDMLPHYELDYRKAKPNRFAGRVKLTHGGARPGAGRKPAPETLVSKRVYLYPRHVQLLKRLDKNMSAALRKILDAHASK